MSHNDKDERIKARGWLNESELAAWETALRAAGPELPPGCNCLIRMARHALETSPLSAILPTQPSGMAMLMDSAPTVQEAINETMARRRVHSPVSHEPAIPLVRYCPGCGSIGEIDKRFVNCCPDFHLAYMVPEAFAKQCALTFNLAVHGSDSARSATVPSPAGMAVIEHLNAKFRSGNGIPVESSIINRAEYRQIVEALCSTTERTANDG